MSSRVSLAYLARLAATWVSMALVLALPQARGDTPERAPEPVAEAPPAGATPAERDAWLSARITALIAESTSLAGARIGVYVYDPTAGRAVFSHNAEQRYNVASNAKVITAAAALARLGPDFRFRTSVLAEAVNARGVVTGDLILRGRGAPDLSTGDLARLADDLILAGVKEVRGGLVLDDSYFDDQVLPPHFAEQPLEQAAFRAPVAALSLNDNAFAVVVRPALSGRGRAGLAIDPANDYIRVSKNEVVTQARGRTRMILDSKAAGDHMDVVLSGQVRADAPVQRFWRRVEAPALYAGAVFRAQLKARGIRVKGKTSRGPTPAAARVLASVESAPLAVLVRELGKNSNNFVAETLLKTLGAESRRAAGPATWEDGVAALHGFLVQDVGLEPDSFRLGNGSGLFAATEITPVQLVRVLVHGYRDPGYGPDFHASLAIAGVDGTLRRRMTESKARGRVRAKTGSLAAVSTLCGVAEMSRTRPLVFAVAVNDMPATWQGRRAARRFQDHVVEALVAYLDSTD